MCCLCALFFINYFGCFLIITCVRRKFGQWTLGAVATAVRLLQRPSLTKKSAATQKRPTMPFDEQEVVCDSDPHFEKSKIDCHKQSRPKQPTTPFAKFALENSAPAAPVFLSNGVGPVCRPGRNNVEKPKQSFNNT